MSANADKVHAYFIGEIVQGIVKTISGVIARGEASVLQISALIDQLATSSAETIRTEFKKFGVELINFNIESINIPQEEIQKLQEVFSKTLEAKELSKVEVGGAYGAIKTFEVLNNAAQNPSDGVVGGMLGAGIGLGAGLPIGQQLGNQMSVDTSSTHSETSNPKEKLKQLKELLDDRLITQDQFDEKRNKILEDL